jgi:hypothetical protein
MSCAYLIGLMGFLPERVSLHVVTIWRFNVLIVNWPIYKDSEHLLNNGLQMV